MKFLRSFQFFTRHESEVKTSAILLSVLGLVMWISNLIEELLSEPHLFTPYAALSLFFVLFFTAAFTYQVSHPALPNKAASVQDTPISDDKMEMYDHLTPEMAVFRAWTEPGENYNWHLSQQRNVTRMMPLLGRALNRMAEDRTRRI